MTTTLIDYQLLILGACYTNKVAQNKRRKNKLSERQLGYSDYSLALG